MPSAFHGLCWCPPAFGFRRRLTRALGHSVLRYATRASILHILNMRDPSKRGSKRCSWLRHQSFNRADEFSLTCEANWPPKVTTTAPPSRRQYKVRSLNSVCRSKLLAPLNQSGGIQSTPAKTALLPPHGMPLARPWLTLRRHEGSSTPKPWPNWAVNPDANTGHGFAIFMAVLVPLRTFGAPAPLNPWR